MCTYHTNCAIKSKSPLIRLRTVFYNPYFLLVPRLQLLRAAIVVSEYYSGVSENRVVARKGVGGDGARKTLNSKTDRRIENVAARVSFMSGRYNFQ